MDAPEGTRLSEYREKKTIERLEQARLERKLERKRKKEAELEERSHICLMCLRNIQEDVMRAT